MRVQHHRTDRAELVIDIHRAQFFRLHPFECILAVLGFEPCRIDQFDPCIACKFFRTFTAQEHMAPVLHHRLCQQDRVFHPAHAGNRARLARCPVHQRSIHLVHAFPGVNRALACVEFGIVLHRNDRRLHRVHRCSAFFENRDPGIEGRLQRGLVRGLLLLGHFVPVHRSGTAMDGDRPSWLLLSVVSGGGVGGECGKHGREHGEVSHGTKTSRSRRQNQPNQTRGFPLQSFTDFVFHRRHGKFLSRSIGENGHAFG